MNSFMHPSKLFSILFRVVRRRIDSTTALMISYEISQFSLHACLIMFAQILLKGRFIAMHIALMFDASEAQDSSGQCEQQSMLSLRVLEYTKNLQYSTKKKMKLVCPTFPFCIISIKSVGQTLKLNNVVYKVEKSISLYKQVHNSTSIGLRCVLSKSKVLQ